MAATIVPEYILPILVRYIDRYYLTWNMATRIISLHYRKKYIEKELKKLHSQRKNAQHLLRVLGYYERR